VHAGEYVIGLRARHHGAVLAELDQRRKNIRDGQEPNQIGYVRRAKPVRISAAVEIPMVMPDRVQDVRGPARILRRSSGLRVEAGPSVLQPHFTVAPHAEIACAFDAASLGQRTDAGTEDFKVDR
jgi:hypothetical protein